MNIPLLGKMKIIIVPCSFNSKEKVKRTEILECKGGVKITDELKDSCWMGVCDYDVINVYEHINGDALSFVNKQG